MSECACVCVRIYLCDALIIVSIFIHVCVYIGVSRAGAATLLDAQTTLRDTRACMRPYDIDAYGFKKLMHEAFRRLLGAVTTLDAHIYLSIYLYTCVCVCVCECECE